MVKVRVLVRLKEGILDVQGTSVKRALRGLGFPEVLALRIGKVLELELPDLDPAQAKRRVEDMCAKLLANPVMEDFTVEVLDGGGASLARSGATE